MAYDRPRMLTVEEETALVARAQGGDQRSMRTLIDHHIPLIVSIAARYSRYGTTHDDLLQEAKLGMVAGVHKFDLERGLRLSTYARWWIRAMVLDWVLENKSLVKLGTTAVQKKLFNQLKHAKNRLGIQGDQLTREDLRRLAADLGESEDDIEAMNVRLAPNGVISMSRRHGPENEGASLQDTLVDDRDDPRHMEERLDDQRRMTAILAAMDTLPARARDIIHSRFLLDDALTLEELGERYSVSRERIRQIEAEALNELRGMLPNKLSRRLGIRDAAVL